MLFCAFQPLFQVELGNKLMPAFQTESGVPYADVNLLSGQAKGPDWSSYSTTSEVTTIQLEFRELSRVSGEPKFKVRSSTKLPPYLNIFMKNQCNQRAVRQLL